MRRIRPHGRAARTVIAAFALTTSLLVAGGTVATAQPPSPESVLSHFLCYEGDMGQFPGASVSLTSTYGAWDVRVGKPVFFCNPVRKTRGTTVTKIVDIRQHLKAYVVKPTTPVPGNLKIVDSNQFGKEQPLLIERTPSRLLVPTRKRPHAAPVGLDHYVCHRVLQGRTIDKGVRLKDQFGEYGTKVLRPLIHCSPTVKKHGDRLFEVRNPQAHLLCYSIEPRNLVPPQTRGTRNQFQQGPITARVATRLCVPSLSRLADPI